VDQSKVNDLYTALKNAKENCGIITLTGNMNFPVESDSSKGGSLLVRRAQIDLWTIYKEMLIDNSMFDVMLILGPMGVGKSWAGMYFLVQAIKEGRTVVFESVPQDLIWVFDAKGSRLIAGVANAVSCPELSSRSSVHIFDAKANGREPTSNAAMLVLFSSTNRSSYAQTECRNAYIACYPSTTEEEFLQYVEFFGIDSDKVAKAKNITGTGSIRNLRQSSDIEARIEMAIARLNVNQLSLYLSTDSNVDGIQNSFSNPALLFSASVDVGDSNLDSRELLNRYSFGNARWAWCSEPVALKVLSQNSAFFEKMLVDLYTSVDEVNAKKSLTHLIAQLLEFFGPPKICEIGLDCIPFSSSGDDSKKICVPKGLRFVPAPKKTLSTQQTFEQCTDTGCLYNFAKNNHGFDAFHPPNTFLNFTSTLTDVRRHSLLYSTFAYCCKRLKSTDVNVVLVVPALQKGKWEMPPAFKINKQTVVDEVVTFEKEIAALKNSKKKAPDLDVSKVFKLNGSRAMCELPPLVQGKLKNMRVFKGFLDISKRSFGSYLPHVSSGIRQFVL
jgi:hypothetical protein